MGTYSIILGNTSFKSFCVEKGFTSLTGNAVIDHLAIFKVDNQVALVITNGKYPGVYLDTNEKVFGIASLGAITKKYLEERLHKAAMDLVEGKHDFVLPGLQAEPIVAETPSGLIKGLVDQEAKKIAAAIGVDLAGSGTGHVPLKDATKLGQKVYGTSKDSTYYCIAIGPLNFAVRFVNKGSMIHVSIRAEGQIAAYSAILATCHMQGNNPAYRSLHVQCVDYYEAARVVASIVFGCGVQYKKVITNFMYDQVMAGGQ